MTSGTGTLVNHAWTNWDGRGDVASAARTALPGNGDKWHDVSGCDCEDTTLCEEDTQDEDEDDGEDEDGAEGDWTDGPAGQLSCETLEEGVAWVEKASRECIGACDEAGYEAMAWDTIGGRATSTESCGAASTNRTRTSGAGAARKTGSTPKYVPERVRRARMQVRG